MNLNTLIVGQRVGVQRNSFSQGTYVVSKVNKVRVELMRESDGYVRIFSVRTGVEKDNTRYHSACIETIEQTTLREERRVIEKARHAAWTSLAEAVDYKDIDDVEAALAALKLVLTL